VPKGILPYGRQSIGADDIRAVVAVLRSERLTQGPAVERFEEAFARYCGARYAVAVSNGTAGLHLAALAAGFGAGDEVVTTPMTFAATSNSLLYVGATPRFADIHPETRGLDPARAAGLFGPKTKGVVRVHFAGQPDPQAPPKPTRPAAGWTVIDDACHALGAEIRLGGQWKKVGGGKTADMSVFSFHPVKHITTGEGGMITTERKDLYETLCLLRSHGIEKRPSHFVRSSGKREPWHYEMQMLGFNYRITDIQCALGASQLKKSDVFVARRREIAAAYDRQLAGIDGLGLPPKVTDTRSSYHLYAVQIDFARLKKDRAQVMAGLLGRGVGSQVHYIPVYDQPYYAARHAVRKQDFPQTEKYYRQALSLPIYPAMSRSDVARVVKAVGAVMRGR
jgi:perosamine synthetase